MRISSKVQALPRSGIRDFFELVQGMDDVISLGIGEPDFATPWHIREAAIYALEKGRTSYSSNLGLPKLRKVISEYVGRWFGIEYHPANEVLVSVGVSEAIDLALRAMVEPGDEVLYHEPCYVSYGPSISLSGGVARPIPTFKEDEFRLRPEVLERAITPRSRFLVLNFPTNPTGAVMERADLEAIAEICRSRDLVVLSDEIYGELVYDGHQHFSIAALPGMKERTVFLHGVSKAFAMTGWRIGFACAPAPLIEAMMKIHQYSILCAPLMGQDAAIEALSHGRRAMEAMRREYELRRNFVTSAFRELGLSCVKPRGAFYVFPDVSSTGLTGKEFSHRLLKEQRVAVVPGEAFGASAVSHVRCSFATSLDRLKAALERIKRFLGCGLVSESSAC